ncbi:MAG TPA: inverse autotransporter beta domain-containing protein [Nitrospinota bacterium]|nr:inverse autotransporter beta domain-containing protein [Nitrospinota bacterium]
MQDHIEPLKKSCYSLKVCLSSSLYLFIANICLIVFLLIPSLSFAEPSFSLPQGKQPLTEWLSKMSPDVRVEQKSQNYYIDNIFSLNLSGKEPNPNSPQSQSLQEWPAKISPGLRGGNGRTLYYVDGLIPFFRKKNSLFFANPRAVFGSNDTEEVNIGMGYRHLLFNDKMFLGINGYFDTQRSENNYRHNQLGLGLEAIITEWFDLRSNFYFPVSGKRTLSEGTGYRFAQRSFLSHTINNFEEPLRGLDYEGGVLIPGISDIIETRAYLGGYNYDSEIGDDINGIKGRIEIRPFPLLAINVEIRDDNAFETDVLVGGYISIPLSFKGWKDYFKKRGKRKPRERMTDLVVRDIDVVSNKSTRESNEQKIYDMVYVDNRNTTGIEDGSLDHPYDTMTEGLSALSDGETLYVFQGSGNYTASLLNPFIVSNQNTIIWGEGHEAFPGCGGGGYPVLDGDNLALPGLRVSADNVEIRGLKVQNSGFAGYAGIYGFDVSGGNIHHNILTNNADGLRVESAVSPVVNNWTVANNTISNNSNYGILLHNHGNLSDFTFSHNTITGNDYGITFADNDPTDMKLGNAATGEGGYNSIYNNTIADFFESTGYSFTAQNNYWGGDKPKLVGGNDDVNYTPWLTTDPN